MERGDRHVPEVQAIGRKRDKNSEWGATARLSPHTILRQRFTIAWVLTTIMNRSNILPWNALPPPRNSAF